MDEKVFESTDPRLVRYVKSLFYGVSFILFGWWLRLLKRHLPRTTRVVDQVPNVMSIARCIAAPVVIWEMARAIWNGESSTAWLWFAGVIGLILLDGLDGPLARQLDATSKFGKVFDPAADKVLAGCLAIAYFILAVELQGWITILVAAVLVSIFWVEGKIVLIAISTGKVLTQLTDPVVPGANVHGKIKFTLEAIALSGAYIWLIINPASPASSLWLVTFLFFARTRAYQSLQQHETDLWNFRSQLKHPNQPGQSAA